MFDMNAMLSLTQNAKSSVAVLDAEKKNAALKLMAQALLDNESEILSCNAEDLEAAKGRISEVMCDRLMLNHERIASMSKGIIEVAELDDPVGRVLDTHTRGDGLKITKVSVPIGVIAIIYESRPNVTSDAAALAIKSGNACVLRTGKEAFRSAMMASAIRSFSSTEPARDGSMAIHIWVMAISSPRAPIWATEFPPDRIAPIRSALFARY